MREAFSLQASGKSLPKETAKLALMEICPSVSGDVSLCRRGRASLPASRVCIQWAAQQELRPTGGIYSQHRKFLVQVAHSLVGIAITCISRPPGSEEMLQHFSAFGFSDTGSDFALMIQGGHLQDVNHPSSRSRLRIRTSENHPADSRIDDCAGAHRTRFLGHVEIAFIQSPITNHTFSLRYREHFGVCCRILQGFNLVPGSCDDLLLADDYCADRDLILQFSFSRLA